MYVETFGRLAGVPPRRLLAGTGVRQLESHGDLRTLQGSGCHWKGGRVVQVLLGGAR